MAQQTHDGHDWDGTTIHGQGTRRTWKCLRCGEVCNRSVNNPAPSPDLLSMPFQGQKVGLTCLELQVMRVHES